MRDRRPEHMPRVPSEADYRSALRIIARTEGHTCIHCQYADCSTSVWRSDAYAVVGAYKRGTVIDPLNNGAMRH